jgi:cytochrome bd-type quinol oxidase subunit 1
MEYPFWYVPFLGSPMLIPFYALLHVLVSHFAVGGGILIWLGLLKAYRENDREFLSYLRSLTRFFVLITVVFGAITGVGIWWTIGLSSPQATSTLIHTFVFGWATEWVMFVIELASALGLFYLWERFTPKAHKTVAFIYALFAWLSLVVITGITSFMATTGRWIETKNFWHGFFNPTFLPSVLTRTGGALLISSLYIQLHLSLLKTSERIREKVVKWTTSWATFGLSLIVVGGLWWFGVVPEFIRIKVQTAPTVTIFMAIVAFLLLALSSVLILGPKRNPLWLSPPLAFLMIVIGAGGMVTGEFVREGTRKPYIVEKYLYSNGIHPERVDDISKSGYTDQAKWVKFYISKNIPDLFEENGKLSSDKIGKLSESEKYLIGESIFHYQCGACHTTRGYNGLMDRIKEMDREMLHDMIGYLDGISNAMPPFAGQEWEIDALTEYLKKWQKKEVIK